MMRGEKVEVSLPKLVLLMLKSVNCWSELELLTAKFVRLRTLKASARICSRVFSVMCMFLMNPKSQLK